MSAISSSEDWTIQTISAVSLHLTHSYSLTVCSHQRFHDKVTQTRQQHFLYGVRKTDISFAAQKIRCRRQRRRRRRRRRRHASYNTRNQRYDDDATIKKTTHKRKFRRFIVRTTFARRKQNRINEINFERILYEERTKLLNKQLRTVIASVVISSFFSKIYNELNRPNQESNRVQANLFYLVQRERETT